jgi:DNA-binding CsgD family transcriptional regulator
MTAYGSAAAGRARIERDWLELVADLVAQPLEDLPVQRLALQLARTLAAPACGFSAAADGGGLAGDIYPRTEPLGGHRAEILEWSARHAARCHPILVHFRATGRTRVVQVADLPGERRHRSAWYATAGRWGCADQLALPLPTDPSGARAFVVARDRPFTPAELEVAEPLCRLIGGLDRQVRALAGRHPQHDAATDVRMTPRELAVLALLADGLTAAAIARRLDIGERTVHKHLEHVYAKLRVTDRLSAVVRAQQAGLLPAGHREPVRV